MDPMSLSANYDQLKKLQRKLYSNLFSSHSPLILEGMEGKGGGGIRPYGNDSASR